MTELHCRQGDLARVIPPGLSIPCPSCGTKGLAVRADTMVVCKALTLDRHWLLEEPLPIAVQFPCGAFLSTVCIAIEDAALRPIRDPGEDAVDQMLIWAGDPRVQQKVRELTHG